MLSQTSLAGLARLPQITLPIGGLCVGLFFVGAYGSDLVLLSIARAFLKSDGKKAIHPSKRGV